jgi:TRAP-type C4-dicarboxylate transport system substrate-binding protein
LDIREQRLDIERLRRAAFGQAIGHRGGIMKFEVLWKALALAPLAAVATVFPAGAQQPIEMKLAYYLVDQHAMSRWLISWSEQLEKASGGRIVVKRFPASQMGPVHQHYDFVRTGKADVAFFLHGATPGRFPLTEIVQVPYLVGSAEIGTKTLNDPELREQYLDREHKDVKVLLLLTHQPGQIHTTKKAIRTTRDMRDLRIRFASPTIRDFIGALGARPVGVQPTEQVQFLKEGKIDGTFIDYGGAGIAFKMAGIVKYTTETYSYVSSFGLAMNRDFWNNLPPDLQAVVTKSVQGVEKAVGEAWDGLDAPGKKLLVDAGTEVIKLSPEEDAKFRQRGAEVAAAKVKGLDSVGLPASGTFQMMQSLAKKHAASSKSFWD